MSQELNKEEIKQCLKDANIYEENLSDDLMNEYYKAIKNSETSLHEENDKSKNPIDDAEKSLNDSANELLEAINNSESVAPSNKKGNDTFSGSKSDDDSLDAFGQDILHRAKSRLKEEEANINNNNNNNDDEKPEKHNEAEPILDIKKTPIGFNDMPKSDNMEKNMLKIISHELKFINIQNSKKFLTSDSETRIKMLCNYHIAAAKLKAHFASLSTNMVPVGKPITAIDHDLCVNPVISSLKEEELMNFSNETTYISRSGRLTKRKVYNEFDESSQDSFTITKKSKNDDDWLSKGSPKASKINLKAKESVDKNANSHSLTEKPSNKSVVRSESPDSSQNDIFVTETKADKFDELKENTPVVPKPRTYQRKQPSNEEIMARSSLFKDISIPKKGRTELLLNAAKEETEKKKQQEEQIEKFTSSLDLDSQALEDETEKIVVDDDIEVFEKKRVVPPLPTSRRPIHGRKRGGGTGPEPLNITTKRPNLSTSVEEINGSPLVNGVTRRTNLPRRASNSNAEIREPSSSTAFRGKKEANMMPCPLCSVSFPQKEIEEHAATCGEDMFAHTPQPKLSRIICEVCDQVVPLTTEYEVHVKECIEKRNAANGFP